MVESDLKDQTYINKIIDKYKDMVYKIAYTMTCNIHDSEDVLQDVFFKFIKTSPNFNDETHEKAWFIRVTINRCTRNIIMEDIYMKKFIFLVLLLFTILFTGCSSNNSIDTPTLRITYKNENISVLKGSFEWTRRIGIFKMESVIADAPAPTELAKKISAYELQPKAQLDLKFTKKPQSIEVVSWGELKDNDYSFTENSITVPNKPVTYILEIRAHWKQGRVSYTTKIIVK